MTFTAGGEKSDGTDLMDTCPRAIVHMRARRERQRLGLVFGSGSSKDLGFPTWDQLIAKVAAHPDVDGEGLLRRLHDESRGAPPSLAAQTHFLFENFRARRLEAGKIQTPAALLEERKIKSAWLKIIHAELYQGRTREQTDQLLAQHPYLTAFTEVIKTSPLTVNYNFDDALERLLTNARDETERETTRGYETTDQPGVQFQKQQGVIYHPNGFIPAVFEDGTSAEVVFATEAFQDQLISAVHGRYLHLSHHLFSNTCLLIGLSLDDTTLQSMLRQNAVKNPGNIHYVVHYVGGDDELSKESRTAIFNANFTAYNLYTLFLNATGIRELASLISMNKGVFNRKYATKDRKYVYYLVGSIGAGKSTAAAALRNLISYDEWIDERLPELAQPQEEVEQAKIAYMDRWIAEQFSKKNYALQECKEGVHIVDRCPLDPLTFDGDRQAKAANLLDQITKGGAIEVGKGHIIMLDCDLDDLELRTSLKHKFWGKAKLQELLGDIDQIYGEIDKTVVCTRGRGPEDVAKAIASVIFLGEYRPIDVQTVLRKFAESAA